MKLFLFAIALVFGIKQSYAAECHWREIDLCLATAALYGTGGNIIPENEENVELFCSTVQEGQSCVGNFSTKCMSSSLRQLLYLFVEPTVQFTQDFCTKGSASQKKWLQHAPCLAEHFDDARPCIDDGLTALEYLTKVPPKDRFSSLCCTFTNIRQCLGNLLSEKCSKDAEDLMDVMLRSLISDLPFTACQSFDPKSDKCRAVLPPPGTKTAGSESELQIVRLLSTFLGS
ncbi:uncharacterized protein LOC111621116 [Centruroides sculpturatus]|uniref:uncharacterized protein LOC111621116 n=1 Tax=Centruroides sculpturatus TaxID=218467 RepID=UPI000C6D37A2|nr:uncharacterized protein LOC111621116 [Centruroides sculpturatus]